ncbi:MAG: nicotinate phosphoribosyltransferase [Mycobacterium leprae]
MRPSYTVDPFGWNNESLNTDWYQWTMVYASWANGEAAAEGIFDLIFRETRDGAAFMVYAGLEQVIEHVMRFQLDEEEIDFICANIGPTAWNWAQNEAGFKQYLRDLRLKGKIRSVPEGRILGPGTFALQYIGSLNEARILETYCLAAINHQTRVASKAVRIMDALRGTGLEAVENLSEVKDSTFEGGTRRAHNLEAALYGARAAYIGGFDGTSNTKAGYILGIPVKGTMAHNWMQAQMRGDLTQSEAELEAFRRWNDAYRVGAYLGDTIDTKRSGIPNAIIAGRELEERGGVFASFRIDSGDLAYDSKVADHRFREAGFKNVVIVGSSDLDEAVAGNIKYLQGGRIRAWLFGTKLETPDPMGGVFKLVANREGDRWVPVIKRSGNPEKVTLPGYKRMYDIFLGSEAAKLKSRYSATVITCEDERIDPTVDLSLFNPVHTHQRKPIQGGTFYVEEPMVDICENGRLLYQFPKLGEIRQYLQFQLERLWPEQRRLLQPQLLHIDLSRKLWEEKQALLHASDGLNGYGDD